MTKDKFLLLFIVLFSAGIFAQQPIELPALQKITAGKKATVAVSVIDFNDGSFFQLNAQEKMPMLSVFKFHIALSVLDRVDKGSLDLNKSYLITKTDLKENTYSPVRRLFPDGTSLTLQEMLHFMVAESDNNVTDYLLKLVGGPAMVQQFLEGKNIRETVIIANEELMHEGFEYMYLNTSTSQAAADLLRRFYDREIISKKSTEILLKIMFSTSTGANKLKAKLPAGTRVAHKTGSSGKDETGLTVAENDIGIIILPNGKAYAIAVFIKDSRESEQENTRMIANISESVYHFFNQKYNQ